MTGAGRGLGRAVAERLAEAGADVVVADVQDELAGIVAGGGGGGSTPGGRAVPWPPTWTSPTLTASWLLPTSRSGSSAGSTSG
ncbi:hypothetical protein [Streptomyces sp. NBRC 110028]|uniref:hypothetical protein n=1 Tax=Streptomyces sp. NBRC 110028 TaxID=1621260 RepID=UPI002277AB10|nr:hypothetical protein [Streptomyces sp. NBRC 110028]